MLTAVAGHRLPHCWRDDSTGWAFGLNLFFSMCRPWLWWVAPG